MHARATTVFAALLGLLAASPGAAQRFGQWWWSAELRADGRDLDNRVGGRAVSGSEQAGAALGFDLNGYLLHPAIGRFRLGFDLRVTELEDGRGAVDTERLGLRGDLRLFPRGDLPIELYLRRDAYDYASVGEEDPLTLLGTPDTNSIWGAAVGLRRGPLKGIRLGFQSSELQFRDQPAARESSERQTIDWSRGGRRLQHTLRLERRLQRFGLVDFATDDTTVSLNQHGDLAPGWRWSLNGVGVRRETESTGELRSAFDSLRLRAGITRRRPNDNLWRLTYAAGRSDRRELLIEGQSLSGSYLWHLGKGWQLGPFAGFSLQQADGFEVRLPQAGLTSNWSARRGSTDLSLSNRLTYVRLDERRGAAERQSSTLASFSELAIRQGEGTRLRKELQLAYARNELRRAGETLPDLPDLGASIAGLGTEELMRSRLSLRRRWDATRADGYLEWTRRSSERSGTLREDGAGFGVGAFEAESLVSSLQISRYPVTLTTNAGRTRTEVEGGTPQEVDFLVASVRAWPWRYLGVRALFRLDRREVDLAPDIDGERVEVGFDARLGLLRLEAVYYRVENVVDGGAERVNSGLRWTLSRRFAGWLPIVSAPGRRGEIR